MIDKLEKIIKLANELKSELKNETSDNKELKFYEKNGMRCFDYKDIKWVEFKPNEFVTQDILSKDIIEDIVEDKRYLDGEKDVRFNNDIFNNEWKDSYVRKILNDKFKSNYLDGLNIENEVRCLTKEETEELPDSLKTTSGYGYWTMSPNQWNGSYAQVFFVNSNGYLNNASVNSSTVGVRPVIKIGENNVKD